MDETVVGCIVVICVVVMAVVEVDSTTIVTGNKHVQLSDISNNICLHDAVDPICVVRMVDITLAKYLTIIVSNNLLSCSYLSMTDVM